MVDRIAAEALNPAYRSQDRTRQGVVVTMATILVVGLLVGVLVVAARERASGVSSERAELVELAQRARVEVAALDERVDTLAAEVRSLREAALGSEAMGAERAEQIQSLAISAGVAPVAGPGARVVLDDGDAALGGGDPALARVLDIDVQQVVNGLWEAGAEAVAVNGQRVGTLTAIRSVQQVILVNYTPVVAPYEVTAIGDPRTLATGFLRSSGGEWLQAVSLSAGIQFGIDAVSDDLQMRGELAGQLRYAVPAPVQGQEAP
jgi:uncharacterized protein YlxW (UPF0749 family)